ncbi:Metallo-dependent phosphatase-like protein, partial [Obelidium mucronatum]
MNGHEHSLAGYLTNNGSTLQIQSGSGGKLDKACAPLDQTFTAGNETLSYGFAHLRIDATKATVDWINESGTTVLSLSVNARVPAVGLTAQPVLANSTDAAIHYTKPKAVDYLIIGDWGALSANLSNVATTMNTWAESTSSQAVISTGDNFYSGAGALSYDGIQTADDAKFTQIWANVFNGTYLKTLPWWTVMGNHDWNGAGSATSELEHQGANWVLPDYFYTKRIEVDTGVYASFIFIETDLLYYNFTGYTAAMAAQFTAVGWNAESNTVAKQLAWIENAIAAANNDAYIFVVGHHPIYTCQGNAQTKFMPTLLSYINKWNVSGYMNGHEHSLAGYLTNNGSTLQIQSGSGGKLDKACAPLDQTFTAGNETLSYGFAHLRLTKTKATVDWVSETGSTVLTLS